MPWADRARCAQPPYSEMRGWIIEPTSGIEAPATVVKLLQVCAECPVRAECLRFALEMTETECYGIWGGSVMTERRGLRGNRQSRHSDVMRFRDTKAKQVDEAFDALYYTLPNRLPSWRRKAALKSEKYAVMRHREAIGRRPAPGL
jgi:hypothetical protein